MAVGAPACGANAAVRSFVRAALVKDHNVLGVYDSLNGLVNGKTKPLNWSDVHGWASKGGSELGTKRSVSILFSFLHHTSYNAPLLPAIM